MIHIVLYTACHETGKMLLSTLRNQAAYDWTLELRYHLFHRAEEAAAYLSKHNAAAISWDMRTVQDRTLFSKIRPVCREAYLLVMASPDTSPLTYLRPDIAPSSLVFFPLGKIEAERAVKELLTAVHQAQIQSDDGFIIEWKGGQQQILYHNIYYFEARNRKLYLRLRGEELGFSGTIEELEKKLPSSFLRCHRSYIVNMGLAEQALFSQGLILLRDGLSVPLSRSYKKAVKDYGEKNQHGGS